MIYNLFLFLSEFKFVR